MRIEVDGVEHLIANLEAYAREVDEDVADVVEETLYEIQANAKLRAPVDTGHLKRNIKVDVAPNRKSGSVYVDKEDVEYVEHVEHGTRYQQAQPFLFPAAEEKRNDLNDEIQRRINRT
ncbi:HK97-gp10 family putative phage morphogenesis protein [Priestia megaterium]|uniref:HK97-gp10 family putative phage morphogenesis protein n=1 Tax=Priestia megaterium TaxID=1404 RepID=UPI003CC5AB56